VLAIVLALVSALGYGGSDFAAGLATRESSVALVTMLSELVSLALLLLIVPWVSTQAPTAAALGWGALAGVAEVTGAMALYLGFRHAPFSVVSSLSAVGTAAFSVLAGLLLGERPGTLALIGIVFALPAIIAVSTGSGDGDAEPADSPHGKAATGRRALGIGMGLLAGAGFAGLFIFLNQAGSSRDLWPVLSAQVAAFVWAAGAVALTRQFSRPTRRTSALAALTGAAGTVGIIFYFLATHRGLLAITAVITSLYPASTIMLARGMLGERLTRIRIAGLCLAAASVALIAVSGG
jgi:drug/metabolite transporter (DMT)-like permease